MDITIEKTNENPYLQRKEVHGKVSFQGSTPSNKQLADALATKLGAKADAISVKHIFTNFGAQNATFEAHVYPSKELLEKVVRLGKKAKEKLAKGAAAAAAPAAAPAPAAAAPAAPAEAPKVEAKPAEAAKPAEKKEEPKKEAPKKEEKPVEKKAEAPKPAEAAKPVEAKKEEPKKAEAKA